jgi:hypothetical protein
MRLNDGTCHCHKWCTWAILRRLTRLMTQRLRLRLARLDTICSSSNPLDLGTYRRGMPYSLNSGMRGTRLSHTQWHAD